MYKKQIGKVIRDDRGNPVGVTSTGHDIVEGLFNAAGTLGVLPFAKEIFGILDSIFCGKKCRARRSAAASTIKGIGSCNSCYNNIGQINRSKRPVIF